MGWVFLLQRMFATLSSRCVIAYGGVSKVDLLRNLFCYTKCVIKLLCHVCENGQSKYLKLKTSQNEYKQIVILKKHVSILSWMGHL